VITVHFAPTGPGLFASNVTIMTSAGDTTVFVAGQAVQADLVVEGLVVNPTGGPADTQFAINFTIRNQGNGTANASTANIRWSASSMSVATTDPLLASISTPSLQPGESAQLSQSVTVPLVSLGSYFVWAVADAGHTANQSDTTNDTATSPFAVTAPPLQAVNGPSGPQGTSAEPVRTATGNYVFQRTDLAIPGRGLPVIFTRTYNSQDGYAGPLGPGWTHSYNVFLAEAAGTVSTKWSDGHGEFYASLGGGAYRSLYGGVFNVLVKNPDGTFTFTLKNQTKYQFSTAGKLTAITDRNGNGLLFGYSGAGNLTTITDTVGRAITLAYDGSNRITQLTDPIGRIVRYTYDAGGNLSSSTDPNAGVMTLAYDASHRVLEIRDERGNRLLANTYDVAGRVATQTNGRGFVTTFAYGTPAAGQTTVTDPRGNGTIHTHDALRRLTKVTDANGNAASFTYDASNNRTSITDQNSRTTLFTYDDAGNVLTITDPLGHVIPFAYDGQNNLKTATNARGFTTIFGYDTPGNLTSIQDAAAKSTVFSYDSFGQLSRKTDARGNVTQYGYDSQGNLARITDTLGGVTALAYDGIGRLGSLTDPNGHTATAGYDANSRLTGIADPLGTTTRFTFDAVGNLAEILDAKANRTLYGYGEVNNLTAVTDALGNITQYAYDANNNRTALINANGHTTSYAFDALNRLSRITDPLGHATTYAYDAVGNVRTVTDANGLTNTFTYDGNNRLTGIAYGDGTSVTYTYDANGNRASMVDQRGTTSYVYDELDRLVQVTHPDARVVRYGYDATGNRASLAYPDGSAVTYSYDALNRLARFVDPDGQVTGYTYDPASNLLRTAYPNGTAVSYQYDAANRLINVGNARGTTPLSSFAYTLDPLGNRTGMTKDGKFLTSYAYDALSQLVAVTNKSGLRTDYTYDAGGNRLTVAAQGQRTQFTYDAADRLLQAGQKVFTYDANGNRISITHGVVTAYAYDAANRLKQVVRGDNVSTYEYDGDGNKISQAINLDVFRFTNDVATALPVILTEEGPTRNVDYVYGLSLVSQASLGTKDFYHYDGLGSVVQLTDSTGTQVQVYAYDAWGAPEGGGHASTAGNRFRFTGEELDDFTDLYYLRARWYDPSMGRFLSRDPFGGVLRQPMSSNRYLYVLNDPLRFVDRYGLSREEVGTAASTTPTVFTASLIQSLPRLLGSGRRQDLLNKYIECVSEDPSCDSNKAANDLRNFDITTAEKSKQVAKDAIPIATDPNPIPTSAPSLLLKLLFKGKLIIEALGDLFQIVRRGSLPSAP